MKKYLGQVIKCNAIPHTEDFANRFFVFGSRPFALSCRIHANDINANAKIELVNMMGQTVSAENVSINNGMLYKEMSISSSLASGIYFARIIVNNKTYTTKLIYQK